MFKFLLRFKRIKLIYDSVLLTLPIIGDLTQKINIIRFTRTLGTLISSGVPILKALEIVKNTATNNLYEKSVQELSFSLKVGLLISLRLFDFTQTENQGGNLVLIWLNCATNMPISM